jgi:hypothetical protein
MRSGSFGAARLLVGAALLLWAPAATAARLAVVVDAPAARSDDITTAVRTRVGAGGNELVDARAGGALDDAALAALRGKLDVARVVAASVQQQGKDHYLITVRAADAAGITRRFGEASGDGLADAVAKVAAELPPLATPTPAPTPTPTPTPAAATADAPATAEATTPASGSAEPQALPAPHASGDASSPPKRKREYGLLVGGIVAFFVPWIATMGLAGNYLSYNPNAARLGFVPMVGPLLAKQHINDKDLKNGYDVGLTVDGAVQIIAAGVLVAGILYAAIGMPARGEHAELPRWRPLFAAGPGGGALGAEVTW